MDCVAIFNIEVADLVAAACADMRAAVQCQWPLAAMLQAEFNDVYVGTGCKS